MSVDAANLFLNEFCNLVLGRLPFESELSALVPLLTQNSSDPTLMLKVLSESSVMRRAIGVKTKWPKGHFYSPIVDPEPVRPYVQRERGLDWKTMEGIQIDVAAMRRLWEENLDFIKTTPFAEAQGSVNRFYTRGNPYQLGDATVLRMMIHHLRPKRIVEIGSGSTTACALDSIEHTGLELTHLTCIEPYPQRLRSFLRSTDLAKVRILEKSVQQVLPDIVDELDRGDILFIDSTHVLKTGSDVHYELFYLLPRLRPGVMVHFHDVPYPFEYSDNVLFDENCSWNEAYALRAFLSFNNKFQIRFWASLLVRLFQQEVRREFPGMFPNPGSAIWIERM